MRRSLIVAGMVGLILAVAAGAFQITNETKSKPRDRSHRDLIGQVTLPDDTPAAGAVVKLKNLHSLEIQSFITQSDGKYVFQHLNPNIDYELKADYKGMNSPARRLTVYDTRLDPVINLKVEAAKKAGEAKAEEK